MLPRHANGFVVFLSATKTRNLLIFQVWICHELRNPRAWPGRAAPTRPRPARRQRVRAGYREAVIVRKSTGLVAVLLTVVLLSLPEGYGSRADETDFHTTLLRSTFKIVGDDGYVGTAFIIGRESVTEGRKTYVPVLVTAAHVLEKIPGDNATLVLRRKHGDEFLRVEHTIPVRRDGKKMWTAHPGEDVAAMPVRFPDDADLLLISDGLLAADNAISERGIHPGTEVLTIGFPFGFEGNPAGFPVVRSGRISSYPLLPTKKTRTFIVDFNVFGGNSGGPVYICDGGRHGRGPGDARTPANVPMIMGLVSSQAMAKTQDGRERLGLAKVVHASLIKETVDLSLGK